MCALSVVSSAVQPRILLTSFLNLPVSGVIINIQKVSCSVSLLLSVVRGNLLSRLQTFITINLARVAYCPYVCPCGKQPEIADYIRIIRITSAAFHECSE